MLRVFYFEVLTPPHYSTPPPQPKSNSKSVFIIRVCLVFLSLLSHWGVAPALALALALAAAAAVALALAFVLLLFKAVMASDGFPGKRSRY